MLFPFRGGSISNDINGPLAGVMCSITFISGCKHSPGLPEIEGKEIGDIRIVGYLVIGSNCF